MFLVCRFDLLVKKGGKSLAYVLFEILTNCSIRARDKPEYIEVPFLMPEHITVWDENGL